ncbi:MAG: restriction endonuclease [Planctomycetaceae bacterium]|nr:restriction endonuclease [Planctomycetaceae bacterium]
MNSDRVLKLLEKANAFPPEVFCVVLRRDEDRLTSVYTTYSGIFLLGSSIAIESSGIAGWVARNGQEYLWNAPEPQDSDPYYIELVPDVKCELCVPVLEHGRAIGAVTFESSKPGFFEGDRKRKFRNLAQDLGRYFLLNISPTDGDLVLPESSLLLPEDEQHARVIVSGVTDELLWQLSRMPERIHSLSPRAFEELVAQLLSDMGYNVQLTPRQKDGGYDVLAEADLPAGRILTLVECKKWSPNNPVSVEVVRGLYGVLNISNATHAMIATTSRFTRDAHQLQDSIKYQLSLKDFDDIKSWLWRYAIEAEETE